jgi:hypothetical protein
MFFVDIPDILTAGLGGRMNNDVYKRTVRVRSAVSRKKIGNPVAVLIQLAVRNRSLQSTEA